jgi:hypothetical protein
MLQHKDHVMSVSAVSTPHVAPQPPPPPTPTQAPAPAPAANNNATGTVVSLADNAPPAQSSSPAPGTGLVVDKHA